MKDELIAEDDIDQKLEEQEEGAVAALTVEPEMDAEPEDGAEPYTSSEVDVREISAGPGGGDQEDSAAARRDSKTLKCLSKKPKGKSDGRYAAEDTKKQLLKDAAEYDDKTRKDRWWIISV